MTSPGRLGGEMRSAEERPVETALEVLKTSKNKQVIYENVLTIRRCVEMKNEVKALREHGGLQVVASLLLHKNIKIMEVVLSILGNCCMERESARQVISLQLIRLLTNILMNHSEDTVLCRVCRVIGNIAQHDNNAGAFYDYKTANLIVDILDKSTLAKGGDETDEKYKVSASTQLMAVRALRLLWKSTSNRYTMVQYGAIMAVSMVMITRIAEWQRYQELLDGVLRCLLQFTETPTDEYAKQILADGNGFKCLRTLIEMSPYNAVKCITNLSSVMTSRSVAESANVAKIVVRKLKEDLLGQDGRVWREYLSALCLLCRHPVNRAELRSEGGLRVLLRILKTLKAGDQEYHVLKSLLNFIYDESGIDILVAEGVVDVLIACLERNIPTDIPPFECHEFQERPRYVNRRVGSGSPSGTKRRSDSTLDYLSSVVGGDVIAHNIFLNDQALYMDSGTITPPDSDSSPLSSPSCTPPRGSLVTDMEDDDSDSYSPVCSDNELENPANTGPSNMPSPSYADDPDEDSNLQKSYFDFSDTKERSIIMILVLLSRLSKVNPPVPELGSPRTLAMLLKYYEVSRYPHGRGQLLFMNIASNTDYLISLMRSDMFLKLYEMQELQHGLSCSKCNKMNRVARLLTTRFTELAETECGTAMIARNMMWRSEAFLSDAEDAQQLVLAVPLVVKSRARLRTLMIKNSGLESILKSVEEDSLRPQAVAALHALARTISINNPCLVYKNFPPNLNMNFDQPEVPVTFRLDDDSLVSADKNRLIENSDYFRAMLTGEFKESREDVVQLRSITNDAFHCLLLLMGLSEHEMESYRMEEDVGLLTVLEVILVSDRYLMPKLSTWLAGWVQQHYLNSSTAGQIYKWSLESGTNILRVECVAYMLVGKCKLESRLSLFNSVIDYGYIDELIDDIKGVVSRYIQISI